MARLEVGFWKNKKVFLTGHTGFKGSWLTLWLQSLGAQVHGYSLAPPTEPSLFVDAGIEKLCHHQVANIKDLKSLKKAISQFQPEIVFHLAAQPLVRTSYKEPVDNYETNVMGTLHLLEACRDITPIKSVVVITTDKVYENKERPEGYSEHEPLGGYDPYSSSKACAEIVTSSYYRSFFKDKNVGVATARAGNVIGGGDWALDRLIPDLIRSEQAKKSVTLRNPSATRPWQHVIEPLGAYLLLAQKVYENPSRYSQAWNFGPYEKDSGPVEDVVKKGLKILESSLTYSVDGKDQPHEAQNLRLNISKAKEQLGWSPLWNIDQSLEKTFSWYKAYLKNPQLSRELCLRQIQEYMS